MTTRHLLPLLFAFGCSTPVLVATPDAGTAGAEAGGSAAGGTAAGGTAAGGTAAGGGAAGASAGGFAGGDAGGSAAGPIDAGSEAGGGSAGGRAIVDAGVSVVRFVAVGDTGKGNTGQAAVGAAIGTLCAQRGCDFVVLLGDNFYPTGVSSVTDPQWQTAFVQPYATVNAPFYAVLGNHDYGGDGAGYETNKADVEVAYSATNPKWRMPAPHYRWSVRDAEFFAADTNRTFWGADSRARADFATWLPASTATWKIAFGHHPYRSNGPHGNAGDYDERCIGSVCASPPGFIDGRNVKSFLEATVCGRADVYLAGHDHSLQWLNANCAGTQLLVSGNGASATSVSTRNPHHFQTTELGFLYVELSGRTFTGTFYGQTGAALFTRSFTK